MTDNDEDLQADQIEAELYDRAMSGDEMAKLFLSKVDSNA